MLSNEDIQAIKQAVLKAVENGNADPENLVYRCINSIERINNYGLRQTSETNIVGVGEDGKPIYSND